MVGESVDEGITLIVFDASSRETNANIRMYTLYF